MSSTPANEASAAPTAQGHSQEQSGGSRRPVRRTGRSLKDMLDDQVEKGVVDLNAPLRPVPTGAGRGSGSRSGGAFGDQRRDGYNNSTNNGGGNGGYYQNQAGGGGGDQWDTTGVQGVGGGNLNWQQQQMMQNSGAPRGGGGGGDGAWGGNGGNNNRGGPAHRGGGGGGFGGDRQPQQQQNRSGFGGGFQQQQQSSGFPQQRRQPNGSGFGGPPVPSRGMPDRPEWADESLFEDNSNMGFGGQQDDKGGLNWQQQTLLKRDENDPFLHLVRGENDLSRE
jgi:hypothetical protein